MAYANINNQQNPKPCPFCGSDNIIIAEFDYDAGAGWDCISCDSCGVEAFGWTLEDWNKRVNKEQQND